MAGSTPTREERDANLDALQTALDSWYDKEKERLETEVQFLKDVREGRETTNVEALNLSTVTELAVAEVKAFLGE